MKRGGAIKVSCPAFAELLRKLIQTLRRQREQRRADWRRRVYEAPYSRN